MLAYVFFEGAHAACFVFLSKETDNRPLMRRRIDRNGNNWIFIYIVKKKDIISAPG